MEGLDPNQLSDRELLLLTYDEVKGLARSVDSHGKRLTSIEAWRTGIVGGGLVIVAIWKLFTDMKGRISG